jgi:hypothetical protein
MNKVAVLEHADYIENLRHTKKYNKQDRFKFNMSSYEDGCGTIGCIAGSIVYKKLGRKAYSELAIHKYEGIFELAKKELGLTHTQACRLFTPGLRDFGLSYNDDTNTYILHNGKSVKYDVYDTVTGPKAAKVMRHLVKTGKIDWKIIWG